MSESSTNERAGASAESEDASTNGGARKRRDNARSQPRMWLQPFLLLALDKWQIHGYELMHRLTSFGFEALDRGSVYRTLRQLEEDGLVSSAWDTSTQGPARRLYSLTDAGRNYLNVWASAFRGYQSMLDQFFSMYPQGSGSNGDEGAAANGSSGSRRKAGS
ncbi:MAG: poly-beta-hydroxybutyrate-responsive repressor [Miltoncostaeaceae bacterium]